MRRALSTGVFAATLAGCGAEIVDPGSSADAASRPGADAVVVSDRADATDPTDVASPTDASPAVDATAPRDAAAPRDATPPEDAGAEPATPFVERDGYVVMEMESAPIPDGHEWVQQTDLDGHTGAGYYRFVGNGICNGPANSPLEYAFEVTRAATYRLHLRAARYWHCVRGQPHNNSRCEENDRTCTSLAIPVGNECPEPDQCIRTDISNDAFVHIEDARGDYVAFDGQPSRSIGDPIKLFGGGNDSWSWTGRNALDTRGQKWAAEWTLAPGVYTLIIEGRSKDFRIDRVLMFDVETGSTRGAQDLAETRR